MLHRLDFIDEVIKPNFVLIRVKALGVGLSNDLGKLFAFPTKCPILIRWGSELFEGLLWS
ncbi:hypothetical protein FOXYSP1_19187 [Fusarium oxysporum f. sp. phaseoli]|jgi:hypothetical protein